MRKLEVYVQKYGPIEGPKLFRALQQKSSASSRIARQKKRLGIK